MPIRSNRKTESYFDFFSRSTGPLTVTEDPGSGQDTSNNTPRAILGGGWDGSDRNDSQYFNISTTGNATDFGDMLAANQDPGGCGSATRACFGGGCCPNFNVIQYVTIASPGNATDFGDMTYSAHGCAGFSNMTRGFICGGTESPHQQIDYFTIDTTGNASDFGDSACPGRNPTSFA